MLTININGLTLCHKGSGGVSHNTLPDVCKTPPFGVPVAYQNEAYSADLVNGTVSVFADGGNMIANMGSQFARSVFDEPGSMGGVISGTNKAETDWISHSFDVFFEGRPACRLTDKLFMNHGNTVNMAGLMQASLPPVPELDDDLFFRTAFPAPEPQSKPPEEATPSDISGKEESTPPREYRPVIRLQDAPGVNGWPFTAKNWHIVVASSYMQAITTDQLVMTGTSDGAGYLLSTKEQEQELMRLYHQNHQTPAQLWLVEGNRAHKIVFHRAGIEQKEVVRDYYAQDTMGYHRKFNQVVASCPGTELWECIRRESGVSDGDSLLDLLAGEK